MGEVIAVGCVTHMKHWLPFLHNACEIKLLLSPKTAQSYLELERRDELVSATDRPQRILVPGRGTCTALLCLHEIAVGLDARSEWNAHRFSPVFFRQEPLLKYAKRAELQNYIVRSPHTINTR